MITNQTPAPDLPAGEYAITRCMENYDFTLPPDIEAEIVADMRRHDRQERWSALRMLWGPAIKNRPRAASKGWTVYDGHIRQRGEEWTLWRGLVATIALIFDRRYGQRQVDRHRDRTGSLYIESVDLGHWDATSDGYGWSCGILRLYPGGRIEVGTDGESTF